MDASQDSFPLHHDGNAHGGALRLRLDHVASHSLVAGGPGIPASTHFHGLICPLSPRLLLVSTLPPEARPRVSCPLCLDSLPRSPSCCLPVCPSCLNTRAATPGSPSCFQAHDRDSPRLPRDPGTSVKDKFGFLGRMARLRGHPTGDRTQRALPPATPMSAWDLQDNRQGAVCTGPGLQDPGSLDHPETAAAAPLPPETLQQPDINLPTKPVCGQRCPLSRAWAAEHPPATCLAA